MKIGDLVQPTADEFGDGFKSVDQFGVGIIVDVVDRQWDVDLGGYPPGGTTFKVMFKKDYGFFNDDELKLISES